MRDIRPQDDETERRYLCGLALFVLKDVVPDASMGDVWKARIAYMVLSVLALALILFFPR